MKDIWSRPQWIHFLHRWRPITRGHKLLAELVININIKCHINRVPLHRYVCHRFPKSATTKMAVEMFPYRQWFTRIDINMLVWTSLSKNNGKLILIIGLWIIMAWPVHPLWVWSISSPLSTKIDECDTISQKINTGDLGIVLYFSLNLVAICTRSWANIVSRYGVPPVWWQAIT